MSFEFDIVLKTTIVIAAAALTNAFLKRASASTRHAVWAIALLSGLVLPIAVILLPQISRVELPVLPTIENEAVVVQTFVPQAGAQSAKVEAVPPLSTPSRRSRPISQWLEIAWALGFAFVLTRVVMAHLRAQRLVQASAPKNGEHWILLVKQLQVELRFSQSVELRNGETAPPMTWGMFRHYILLPSQADSWTLDQQRAVLAHELAHAKRRDGLIQFLVEIVCSLYWFNPLIWMAARLMRLERERSCDDYSLKLGSHAGGYANHLLQLATGTHLSATAAMSIAHPSQIETRLRAILDPTTRRNTLSRTAAMVMLTTIAVTMFPVAAIHLTTILSLSLPTTFSAMAAPLLPRAALEPERQQPAAAANSVGAVAGRVLWADGAAAQGAMVSAIATSTVGLPATWVMGTKVAGTAITDTAGRYRIEALPPGLYHIVTGPVSLPRTFSDVALSSGTHLITVTAGKTADGMDFTRVRNAEGIVYDPDKILTITGKLAFSSFGGPSDPNVVVNNDDGSVSHWQFRGSIGSYRYWWPGLDSGKGGPLEKMANAGENVTITGTDGGYVGRPTLHVLLVREVTRGGLPNP